MLGQKTTQNQDRLIKNCNDHLRSRLKGEIVSQCGKELFARGIDLARIQSVSLACEKLIFYRKIHDDF